MVFKSLYRTSQIDHAVRAEKGGMPIETSRAIPELEDDQESGRRIKSDCVSQLNPGALCYPLSSNRP